jgi:hypothetical protein
MQKCIKVVISAAMLATLCLCLAVFAAAYEENTTAVKGTVYSAESNDKGESIKVLILTVAGDELLVDQTAKGNELLKLVEQNVKVTGAVLTDKQGRKTISVSAYEILFN